MLNVYLIYSLSFISFRFNACLPYFHSQSYNLLFLGGIEIRLQNGSNPLEGRVEVKLNGEWKTLCDSNWDFNDAKGICTSVGIR